MSRVSVPEKTLEHWASQYLTYRYRSWAALWWPVDGEDINVKNLPRLPGKTVQIELKTTTPAGKSKHDVKVDIGQLNDYLTSSAPVFYAFPRPEWKGNLERAAHSAGVTPTEIAFSRSGTNWWFAEWMIVMTANEVASVLSKEVAAHAGTARGHRKRLVQFTTHAKRPTTASWAWGAKAPVTYRWRDFWKVLEGCGETGWPQIVRLPSSYARARTHLSRREVFEAMTQSADNIRTGEIYQEPLLNFETDGENGFRLIPETDHDNVRNFESIEDEHRQVVFLDARAMRQQQ